MPTVLAKPESWQLEVSVPELQVRLGRGLCLAVCAWCHVWNVHTTAFSGRPKTGNWDVKTPESSFSTGWGEAEE